MMTRVAAASSAVTAFGRSAPTALWRAAAVGFGTAIAAGLTAGAVTVTAASIVALGLRAAPHLDATMPLGPKTSALANPASLLAGGAAKFSGLVRVLTHTVHVADAALQARLISAEILTAALSRTGARAPAGPALPEAADAGRSATSSISSVVYEKRTPAPPRGNALMLAAADSRTAIYDIEAHTVYLPGGQRLEAHSGLGQRLDDPRHVGEKNRGATPPNVYDLVLREAPFHGVQAIRLNPVDDGKMFGRDGILAHTYMLGPSGQSFGCVSFKDYQQFLKAFLRGEIDRLVVVPYLEAKAANGERARSEDSGRYVSN
jgi:Protein of unknown function (DUF2778)